jgi:tight adherence protein B
MIDLSFFGLEPIDVAGLDARFIMYIGLFLGILATVEGLRQFFSPAERQDEAKGRRIKLIQSGKSTEDILNILKPKENTGLLSRLPLIGNLPALLRQAGLTIPPTVFVVTCLGGFVLFVVAGSLVIDPIITLAVATILFLLLPVLLVKSVKKKRMSAFVAQLPDALELMSRGLKVGHPLGTTLRSVAEDMPDPIGSEFGVIVDQVAYGDDLVDAFRELAERVEIEDVHYLSVSIGIQHGTGGDLARILNTLSRVIRNRIMMRRRIRAVSSEGRLSAIFLSALPVILFGFTSFTAPDYYGDVSDDPLFGPIAFAVVFLVVANYLALRKVSNFRI